MDPAETADLHEWARLTWASMEAMCDPATGLVADHLAADLSPASRSRYTSPTNIGGWLWSCVAARELGLIDEEGCRQRVARTVATLTGMQRHEPSGMFYNWYDEHDARRRERLPGSEEAVMQFLSSVDNGWLGVALQLVRNAVPELVDTAEALLASMRWRCFFDPEVQLLRGGFSDQPDAPGVLVDHLGCGVAVRATPHHYTRLNSEPRSLGYLAMARGDFPTTHYWSMPRRECHEYAQPRDPGLPTAPTMVREGVTVVQDAMTYRGVGVVPTWGGSAFEAFMPSLFVPEAQWSPGSWGVNHHLTARLQREFGLDEAGYGLWGFSPASGPDGSYGTWGVEPIGTSIWPYPSDVEGTGYRQGMAEGFGDGVVTPHALFLCMEEDPSVIEALERLRDDYHALGPGGFLDAVGVRSHRVAQRYLSLDQSMVMAALANHLAGDAMRRFFCAGEIEGVVRPLLAMEDFGPLVGPQPPAV